MNWLRRVNARRFAYRYVSGDLDALQELIDQGRCVVRCACGYEGCDGYAMVSRETVEELQAKGMRWLGGTDYSRIYWP